MWLSGSGVARSSPTPPIVENRPLAEVVESARMRFRRYILLGALVGAACQAPASLGSDPPQARPSAEPRTDCEFPQYRPTYLPWLAPGSPVPEPGLDRLPGGGPQGLDPAYAILVWDADDKGGGRRSGGLSLWRSTESVGAIPADPEVPLLPDGATGRLYEGEDGQWSVVWVDPFPNPYDDPCSETTLSLTMPRLSPDEQRQELLRVARSFDEA